MIKLNIGCGNDLKEGFVNVDSGDCKCDVKHDIETIPWVWDNDSVDYILMQHVLEHVHKDKFIEVVREMYRVCHSGALIDIFAPYAGSDNFWTDPTHHMPLTVRTFDYFDPEKALHENGKLYGWNDCRFQVVNAVLMNNPPNGPDVVFKLAVIK